MMAVTTTLLFIFLQSCQATIPWKSLPSSFPASMKLAFLPRGGDHTNDTCESQDYESDVDDDDERTIIQTFDNETNITISTNPIDDYNDDTEEDDEEIIKNRDNSEIVSQVENEVMADESTDEAIEDNDIEDIQEDEVITNDGDDTTENNDGNDIPAQENIESTSSETHNEDYIEDTETYAITSDELNDEIVDDEYLNAVANAEGDTFNEENNIRDDNIKQDAEDYNSETNIGRSSDMNHGNLIQDTNNEKIQQEVNQEPISNMQEHDERQEISNALNDEIENNNHLKESSMQHEENSKPNMEYVITKKLKRLLCEELKYEINEINNLKSNVLSIILEKNIKRVNRFAPLPHSWLLDTNVGKTKKKSFGWITSVVTVAGIVLVLNNYGGAFYFQKLKKDFGTASSADEATITESEENEVDNDDDDGVVQELLDNASDTDESWLDKLITRVITKLNEIMKIEI